MLSFFSLYFYVFPLWFNFLLLFYFIFSKTLACKTLYGFCSSVWNSKWVRSLLYFCKNLHIYDSKHRPKIIMLSKLDVHDIFVNHCAFKLDYISVWLNISIIMAKKWVFQCESDGRVLFLTKLCLLKIIESLLYIYKAICNVLECLIFRMNFYLYFFHVCKFGEWIFIYNWTFERFLCILMSTDWKSYVAPHVINFLLLIALGFYLLVWEKSRDRLVFKYCQSLRKKKLCR